ncbi:MAG: GGDEF domain-containing protein [Gammaproteobacteria bacterium]|nr:GGDEF domain-containing protein [Gammaproteobacteria bacterium]
MTDNTTTSTDSHWQQLAEMLESLKHTAAGASVYDQLHRVLQDWQQARVLTDRAHGMLFSFLLESCQDQSNADALLEMNARLIRARDLYTKSPTGLQQLMTGCADPEQLVAQLASLKKGMDVPTKPVDSGAEVGLPPQPGVKVYESTPNVERRVNTAYRHHLDQKRSEIERIQDALENEAREAMAQNKEFGALLQTELAALESLDSVDELEQLKQILIGGTRELLDGQRVLQSRLAGSWEYMSLIRSSSENLRDELNKVRLLSLTDDFTSLPNRRAFMRRLEDEIGRAQRYGTPLALALIDLDNFKDVNDEYGHSAGDDVLKWYAARPLSIFRHYDMVARYGGEEFSILLPSTDETGAVRALEKAAEVIVDEILEHKGGRIAVPTFSAGLTLYRPGESIADLIDRADRAMYRAKHNGRNRVEIDTAVDPGSSKAMH